jgi:hypothetical protein
MLSDEPRTADPPALAPEGGNQALLSSTQPAARINAEIRVVDAFTPPMWTRPPDSAQSLAAATYVETRVGRAFVWAL